MMSRIENRLRSERTVRGWSQSRAAEAAGVSRQSYSAIESGAAVPSTEVSLRLARAFGVRVEDLFALPDTARANIQARWGGLGSPWRGQPVRVAQVAGELVALEAVGHSELARGPADGLVVAIGGAAVEVALLAEGDRPADLVVAGCDPSFPIVAEILERERGIRVAWTPRGSRAALAALQGGTAHVAGVHLRDPEWPSRGAGGAGEAPLRCTRITFADWEQGLLTAPGNPRGVQGVEDLARGDVRIVNREEGSGSRILLEASLERAGISPRDVRGFETCARGHLAVGEAIAAGLGDAGVAIRAAGLAYGLDVIGLEMERYELVIPDHFLDLPAVQALLDVLRRPGVRAQVEALGGYDAAAMGMPA